MQCELLSRTQTDILTRAHMGPMLLVRQTGTQMVWRGAANGDCFATRRTFSWFQLHSFFNLYYILFEFFPLKNLSIFRTVHQIISIFTRRGCGIEMEWVITAQMVGNWIISTIFSYGKSRLWFSIFIFFLCCCFVVLLQVRILFFRDSWQWNL